MPWDPMKPGASVCVCHSVGHDECRDRVMDGRVTCMAELSRQTGAGGSCGLCVPYFNQIIAHYAAIKAAKAEQPQGVA